MSQQCLPLPSSTKKKKENDKATDEPNENEEDQLSNQISGSLLISNLQEMDAITYLGMVHEEANNLPNTFTSIQKRQFKKQKTSNDFIPMEGTQVYANLLISKRMDLVPCPSPYLLPTSSWIETRLNDFDVLCNYLKDCSEKGQIGKDRTKPLPPMKHREGWHEFCLGRKEAEGNENDYFDYESSDEEIAQENSHPLPPWMKDIPEKGHDPTVALLLQFDQIMTRKVLGHFIYFIKENWSFSVKRLLWIYSLLALVQKPLHEDEQAGLRLLLRECTKRRAQFSLSDERVSKKDVKLLAAVNLIIAVVAFRFDQGDKKSVMQYDIL